MPGTFLDYEQIKTLRSRYFRAMDTGNGELLASVLADDITTDLVGSNYRIRYNNKKDFVAFVTSSLNSDSIAQHFATNPEIEVLTDTTARGIWYLQDWALHIPSRRIRRGSAIITDTYEKIAGAWKIKTYRYDRVYEIFDTLPADSEISFHYLGEHGLKPHERAQLKAENTGSADVKNYTTKAGR
jgi:hypothetical protein